MRRMTPLAALLAAGACTGVFAPERPPLPPSTLPLTFAAAPWETTFAVEAHQGAIVVRDRTITGVCHRYEDRGAYRDGEVVTLWIAHTGSGRDPCISVGRLDGYMATVSGLSPGSYRLRVQYIGDIDTGTHPRPPPETAVEVR
jgi:hypothetical protein